MGVNFNDTTQPADLEVCAGEQKFKVSITAPVGELLQPHTMSEGDFTKEQSKYAHTPCVFGALLFSYR
jgi:AP-3 complex subunit beta